MSQCKTFYAQHKREYCTSSALDEKIEVSQNLKINRLTYWGSGAGIELDFHITYVMWKAVGVTKEDAPSNKKT